MVQFWFTSQPIPFLIHSMAMKSRPFTHESLAISHGQSFPCLHSLPTCDRRNVFLGTLLTCFKVVIRCALLVEISWCSSTNGEDPVIISRRRFKQVAPYFKRQLDVSRLRMWISTPIGPVAWQYNFPSMEKKWSTIAGISNTSWTYKPKENTPGKRPQTVCSQDPKGKVQRIIKHG